MTCSINYSQKTIVRRMCIMQIGWNMVIETTNGIVGLWTCWMGNSIKLFYPLDVTIPDEVIMETLNVTLAKPVANERFGTRLWAKYYSEKLEDCGRVWIGQETSHSYGHNLKTIRNKKLVEHYCGHNCTNTVWTYDSNFCSEAEPEAPNCKAENIQAYREKFVQLLVKVAKLVGDITAVNIDSELVLYTPETLAAKGYDVTSWKVGYTKYCYAQDENFEIILKSGNSLVSWSSVIRYPSTNELTAESLIKRIDSLDSPEEPINLLPLIVHLAKQERIYKG